MSVFLKLNKFRLTAEELADLPKDQVAAFGVSCHAINEIHAMNRIYLFAGHQKTSYPDIDVAALIQRLTLLRVWSAKIFEYSEFTKFKGKYNRTKDRILQELSRQAQEKFASLCDNTGFESAKRLRNESTNHYCISPARQNFNHIAPSIDASFFLANKRGNSFFPFGEDLVFGGSLSRYAEQESTSIEVQIADWVDFNIEASGWAFDFHASLTRKIVVENFPGRILDEKVYWLPECMAGPFGNGFLPVFSRDANS